MSWNNGYERKKFELAQRRQASKYRKLGMTEEQIEAMYKFDLEQFKSERRFYSHTVSFEPHEFDPSEDAEDRTPLLNLFSDVLTTSIDNSKAHSRFWWVEELDDAELIKRVKLLSEDNRELLTLYVFDGYNQTALAGLFNVSQQCISKRIKKFEKIFLIRL